MYCGDQSGLTREHIVPHGLNGNLVLPESSCVKCAEVTSKVELSVLRDTFGMLREKHGIKSRKRTKRPPFERSIEILGASSESFPLSASQLPSLIALPHWGSESLYWFPLLKQPELLDQVIFRQPEGEIEQLSQLAYNRHFKLPKVALDRQKFAAFFAKIALGFAYASFGGLPVKSDLSQIVLMESSKFRHRIGSELEPSEGQYLWKVALALVDLPNGSRWLGSQISLFTPFQTPTYLVLIGEDKDRTIKLPPFSNYAIGLNLVRKDID